jgi:hypothetical protein
MEDSVKTMKQSFFCQMLGSKQRATSVRTAYLFTYVDWSETREQQQQQQQQQQQPKL